jgi:WD40 repeat protein
MQVFYGPEADAVYAFDNSSQEEDAKLNILSIKEQETSVIPTALDIDTLGVVVSPDGSKGFLLQPKGDESNEMAVTVVDLQSLQVLHTFWLDGVQFSPGMNSLVLNRDGSKLYAWLTDNPETVRVIDTQTGQVVRELALKSFENGTETFSDGDIVGDSILLSRWGYEDGTSSKLWLDGNGERVAADKEIYSATEAGGTRYAVNAAGTQLFELDADNHIRKRMAIARPDMRAAEDGAESYSPLTVYRITSSPDGKYIILFIGMEEEGC